MAPPAKALETSTAAKLLPLHALLDERAASTPATIAYRFLADGEQDERILTLGQLADRARRIARGLADHGVAGKPVLLLEPPGPGFIEGLFACWHAGAIAVPAYPPRGARHRKRLDSIIRDCRPEFALVSEGTAAIPGVRSLETGVLATLPALDGATAATAGPCVLQYTSGSTADPKGVMISHSNLRSHHASLGCYDKLELRSALSWLPPYHDMGLVLKILHAFEAGIPLTWFSPDHFIQRPVRWLRAISRYRAELSGAPNFAFEACLRSIRDDELADLDLSCWKAAPCGAERIRADTLERFALRFAPCGFRKQAFLPGYGLAETTLIVTAHPPGGEPAIHHHPHAGRLVSSGMPLENVDLRIADPETDRYLQDGMIGEIRVSAPVVAMGYWNRPAETAATFGSPEGGLRTGDLGYIMDGHLFVIGRSKDLIILDGVNHAPEDIEEAALSSSPEIAAAAAFACEFNGRETVTLALEVSAPKGTGQADLCGKIRREVAAQTGIAVHRIVCLRPGLLPRTTSGKIRRSACRTALADGSLKLTFDDAAGQTPPHPDGNDLLQQVLTAVAEVAGHSDARAEDDLIGLGMGSLEAARLAALLATRTGIKVPVGEILTSRSFGDLAARLDELPPSREVTLVPCQPGTLTHSQERMWYLHQFDPTSAAYHVFGVVELAGALDVHILRRAFDSAVARHAMLRSRHGLKDGRIQAWIEDQPPPTLTLLDIAGDAAARSFLVNFATTPFDLENEAPARFVLLALGDNRHLLAICAHHIAADGWSMRILAAGLAEAYASLHTGRTGQAPRQTEEFMTFAARHRAWTDSHTVDTQVDYWRKSLAGHSGVIQLPVDFPRPAKPSAAGGLVTSTLPATLCNQIATLARNHRATPFMVHLAAFFMLLRQHAAGDDLVAAVPVANRHLPGSADLMGTLVNTLPFRMTLDPSETFSSLLDRVRYAAIAMQENQDAPFERIVEAVGPVRSPEHAPLAQVMFDHQEIPIADQWPGGIACKPYHCHRGASQFDLSLLLNAYSDHQQLCIEYRSDLFRGESAAAMLERYLDMLDGICTHPEYRVERLAALAPKDIDWLESSTYGPSRPDFPERTAPDLITKRSLAHPDRIAVSDGHDDVTYGGLALRSDRIAAALANRGVRQGDRVAVLLERDCDLPAALLAIWKCGAAYVPLDRGNPKARLALVLTDQQPLHVLVSSGLDHLLPPDTGRIRFEELPCDLPVLVDPPSIQPSAPAYVIHTSGSTGTPKGVVVSHGALANFLLSMAETPGFTEADHILAVTTVSFDISTLEIFLPLVTGGRLTLVPAVEAGDGPALLERLGSSGASVMQATPATWRILMDAGWRGSPDLKILCGGEAMDPALADRLAPMGCQLWNLYGPTETTVWSTCWRVPHQPPHVRIGQPIANTGVHILAPDGTLLPPGVPGDLWISGAGLADRYWNQPDLTTQRFATITDHAGRRLRAYQTGDIARWHPDGSLECLGRSDGQIKIRGFRVETGEIEATLAAHPAVSQAKVALRGPSPESRRLVAWITLKADHPAPEIGALREFLADRLPLHMLPADIGVIGEFPLGASGKVDVSKLDTPELQPRPQVPLTQTTDRLLGIWTDLLARPAIHPDDDWFHIGGHSLLALRMFSRIHQDLGTRLPLSAILDHNTPRKLAALIDQSQAGSQT